MIHKRQNIFKNKSKSRPKWQKPIIHRAGSPVFISVRVDQIINGILKQFRWVLLGLQRFILFQGIDQTDRRFGIFNGL